MELRSEMTIYNHLPYPDTTTIKSMMFQGFLRYESGWRTKPMATILVHISTVKIPRK